MENFESQELEAIKESVFMITGGCGYIGCHVAQMLVALNAKKVIAIDSLENDPTLKRRIHHISNKDNFDFYSFDIKDTEQIDEIIDNEDVNYIIHLATDVGINESIDDPVTVIAEFDRFVRMMNLAREYNVKFVYGSSSCVYDVNTQVDSPISEDFPCKPRSPYAATKLGCENLARSCEFLDSIGVRFFNVYGPDYKHKANAGELDSDLPFLPIMIKRALKGKRIEVENPNEYIDLMGVYDCTVGLIKLMMNDDPELWSSNNIVNMGGNLSIRKRDLVNIICALASNVSGKTSDVLVLDYDESSDSTFQVANIERFVKYSDYVPQIPPQHWLPEMMNYYYQIIQAKEMAKKNEVESEEQ